MRRLLLVVLLLLMAGEEARASCSPPNPRAQLKYAQAAIDGRFVSERFSGDRMERWLTFRVDRVLKGEVGPAVEIYERGMTTINFGRLEPGQRVGLTMNFKDGQWLSNDCQTYDPEELADAVEPLPRPPGRGRAAYVVAGAFGDARLAVLDRRGRTLAYGFGSTQWADVTVCPGGRRIVEAGYEQLIVRRVRDLRVLRRIRLGFTRSAHCLGRTIVRATSSGIFRGGRQIWRGRAAAVVFHRRAAYVTRGHEILRVDLRSGRARTVATLPLTPQHEELRSLAVSPDGRRLAVLAPNWPVQGGEPPSQVAVVDMGATAARVRVADLPQGEQYSGVAWAGAGRFAVTAFHSHRVPGAGQPARFYDARLRPLGEIAGWTALPVTGAAGAVMGAVGHRLQRATPAGASELGRLPGSQITGVHRLPGVEIRAPRRIPRY
jgi:hypothetical protein